MKDIEKLLKNKVVGAQLFIYSSGESINYNYGNSSLKDNMLIDDKTIFRIASISKIVVAMAALKLMEEGKLNIDEDISNIFGFKIRNPKYPNDIITTKMLMLHTSSILDGYNDEDLDHNGIEKGYNGVNGKKYFVDLKDLLANEKSEYYTDKTYANYKPGSAFSYSNFGTGILACVVEAVSSRYFTEYVETEILKPLNLDASFIAENIIKKDKISGTFYYDEKDNEFKVLKEAEFFINRNYPKFPFGNNFRGPAGGLFISMKELNIIMQVLLNDGLYKEVRILNKSSVDLMLQMHYLGSNKDYLAKGLQLKFIDHIDNALLKGHTGNAYGVRSFMFFSKEFDFGVCFITNGGIYKDFTPDFNEVHYKVLEHVQKKYLKKKNRIVNIDKSLNVNLNNRNIILNKIKIENYTLFVDILDIANILDVIPKIEDGFYYINNIVISSVNNSYISLDETLNILNINYEKENSNYKIIL